jgi:hypothetical protein
MGSLIKKNIYYKGVRPALGVRTRDQQGHNNYIDRVGRPGHSQLSILAESMRQPDDNLFRESVLARVDVDYKWSTNQRDNTAFGDHDDSRHDWS